METTPDDGASGTVEERLAAHFGGAAESAPEEAAADDEAIAAEVESEPESEDSGLIEEEVDGVVLRGSKEAVEAFKSERAHKADYTRRTQEAAQMRQAAEDRMQFAEAREHFVSALMTDYASLQAKQTELKQLNEQDLGALYESSPSLALRVQQRIQSVKDEIAQMQGVLSQKAQNMQSAIAQHRDKQWNMAVEAYKARTQVSPSEDVAMLRTVTDLGFSQDELKSRFADPRFLALVHDAAKYRSIQSGKTLALDKAAKAPPVLKPGATPSSAATDGKKYQSARQQLRKSGNVNDAARLLAMRG